MQGIPDKAITSAQPVSRTWLSQGLELNYLDWGNEDAEPLLLVHGMWDHAHSWDRVAAALRNRWRVIVPDLRGHGDSGWSPEGAYLAPYYLVDLVELVKTLGLERFSLIAHSFGGNPAARYAALYPDRVERLVLIDAMGPTRAVLERWEEEGPVNRTRDWVERRLGRDSPSRLFTTVEDAAAKLIRNNRLLKPEQALHLALHGVRRDGAGYRWKYDPAIGNLAPEDFAIHLAHYWREITAPTLLCWGPEGWTTDPAADGSAACFRNASTRTFERSGHWIHHEQFDDFIEAVCDFLLDPAKSRRNDA